MATTVLKMNLIDFYRERISFKRGIFTMDDISNLNLRISAFSPHLKYRHEAKTSHINGLPVGKVPMIQT